MVFLINIIRLLLAKQIQETTQKPKQQLIKTTDVSKTEPNETKA